MIKLARTTCILLTALWLMMLSSAANAGFGASNLAFSKAFGAANIALSGSTSLTFTLVVNTGGGSPVTGIDFNDALPAGLVVSTPNGLTSAVCPSGVGAIAAVAGSNAVSLTGGTIPFPGNCTFSVNVTGTTPGVKNNSVTTTAGNMFNGPQTANATVTVLAAVLAAANVPTLSEWGTILLVGLFALFGVRALRRRR